MNDVVLAFRWITVIAFGGIGVFCILANLALCVMWLGQNAGLRSRKKLGSCIPLVGGVACAVAVLVMPLGEIGSRVGYVWWCFLADVSWLGLLLVPCAWGRDRPRRIT